MKRHAARFLCIAAGLLIMAACSSSDSPVRPGDTSNSSDEWMGKGLLVVQVYFDGQGIPDKRIEIVELGVERTTNEAGYAKFYVPAGEYTVRAYNINRGGPPLLHIDVQTIIAPGKEERVRIFDCLVCV